jgi:hypothetical protein
MRGTVLTATGMTWAEVDGLSLPQLWSLFRYWAIYPPAHLAIRGAPWYPKTSGKTARAMTEEDVAALAELVGPATGLPDDVRDAIRWAEEMKLKIKKPGRA